MALEYKYTGAWYCTVEKQGIWGFLYDVKVHPQPPPPAKVDSDHNIVYAMVLLSGRVTPNRRVRLKKQNPVFRPAKI